MTDYAYHDLELPGSIHVPHDLEYATAGARKTGAGIEARHEDRLALQTNDRSLWRLKTSSPVAWEFVAPPPPVVGDINKFLQIITDGGGDLKGSWLALSPDVIYNLGSGTRTITVDAGTYKYALSGAYDHQIDLTSVSVGHGSLIGDGVGHCFNITKEEDSLFHWQAIVSAADVTSLHAVDIVAAAGFDFTFGARGETITLNEVGQESLSAWFEASSIVGALNEISGGHTLDDAYNAFDGAGTVEVDDGSLTWEMDGDSNFIFDLTSTNTAHGIHIDVGDTGDYWWFDASTAGMSVVSYLEDFTINCSDQISLTAAGGIVIASKVVAETYSGQSGNIWSIKANGGINGGSTATILCLEADTANWNAGARVLKLISDDNDAIPLAVNDGAGDVAYIYRSGAAYFKGYSKFGAGTTGHSLSADGDLLVSGKLEVDGTLYADGLIAAESYTQTSGNIWSIKATPATASTAKILRIEADGANWGSGARVLELVSDDADAIPLTVNDGAADVACIYRSGAAYFKGYSKFGDGTTGHSLSADGDLLVSGKLEVDGNLYCDNPVYFASGVTYADNVAAVWGTGNDAALKWVTADTPDTLVLGLGADSNGFVICELADIAKDFAHALQTNPTLFIHSANQSTTEWISFYHDQTDGVINVGTGTIRFADYAKFGAGATSHALSAAGDVLVSGKLEVDGALYADDHIYIGTAADIDIYRGSAGDLTFGDSITYNDRKFRDIEADRLWTSKSSVDFLNSNDINWYGTATAAGTAAIPTTQVANHPGIIKLTSAVATNSGYAYRAVNTRFLINGGDLFRAVFTIIEPTNATHWLGFAYGTATPTQGTYIEISALTASGKTNNGAGSSNTTGTTYVLTANTWYRAEIETSQTGATATFKIYTCSDQVCVWSESLTNYGDGGGHFPLFSSYSTAAGPLDLSTIDYLSYECLVDLVR